MLTLGRKRAYSRRKSRKSESAWYMVAPVVLLGLGLLAWIIKDKLYAGKRAKKLSAKVKREREENWRWQRQFKAARKEGFYD